MKTWIACLMILGAVILLVRYLLETEEGALETAAQRTAKLVREKGSGATKQAARGIETLAKATHRGQSIDDADMAAASSTSADDAPASPG